MIRKRQLTINAISSMVQVLVVGISYFVVYRFVKDQAGIEHLGVWSLVVATTMMGSVANLGLATGTVKFVSMYLAREDRVRVVAIVQTAFLSLALVMVLMLVLLYPFIRVIIQESVEPELQTVGFAILPYAMVTFWGNTSSGVLQATLEGFQRYDWRNGFQIGSTMLFLVLAFLWVPERGIIGLVQAQVIQSMMLLGLAWYGNKRLLPELPLLPFRWHKDVFREMLSYNLSLQALSVIYFALDPLAKMLVMNFGGAAMAGNFEFANRMVIQVRFLFSMANQAIVPAIADLQERSPNLIVDIYHKSMRILVYLIFFSLPFCIVMTPFISRAWLGTYEPTFVLFSRVMFIAWFFNMLSNPAAFAYQGIGRLRWNIVAQLIMAALNVLLGYGLAWWIGGEGAVIGFMIAIILGSLFLAWIYQHEYGISWASLFEKACLWLLVAALVGMVLGEWVDQQLIASWGTWITGLVVLSVFMLITGIPLWRHPVREQLVSMLMALRHRVAGSSTEDFR